jgi:hypothetical protein
VADVDSLLNKQKMVTVHGAAKRPRAVAPLLQPQPPAAVPLPRPQPPAAAPTMTHQLTAAAPVDQAHCRSRWSQCFLPISKAVLASPPGTMRSEQGLGGAVLSPHTDGTSSYQAPKT